MEIDQVLRLRLRSPFGLIVKRLWVTMLVSKQEARKTKLEHPDSIHESPCLSADRDTSFDNDKRHFQFNDTGILTVTFHLPPFTFYLLLSTLHLSPF